MLGLNKPKPRAKSAIDEKIEYLKRRINDAKGEAAYNESCILRNQKELNEKLLEIEAFEIMLNSLIIANKGS